MPTPTDLQQCFACHKATPDKPDSAFSKSVGKILGEFLKGHASISSSSSFEWKAPLFLEPKRPDDQSFFELKIDTTARDKVVEIRMFPERVERDRSGNFTFPVATFQKAGAPFEQAIDLFKVTVGLSHAGLSGIKTVAIIKNGGDGENTQYVRTPNQEALENKGYSMRLVNIYDYADSALKCPCLYYGLFKHGESKAIAVYPSPNTTSAWMKSDSAKDISRIAQLMLDRVNSIEKKKK